MLFEGADRPISIPELLDGVVERGYDVFLSYSSVDRPAVRQLATLLRERGIRPWMDEACLTPGEPWQHEIVEAITACRCLAVLVGPSGLGNWQTQESQLVMDESVRLKEIDSHSASRRRQKIAANPPAEFRFLAQRIWVEFGDDFDEQRSLRLCRGISG